MASFKMLSQIISLSVCFRTQTSLELFPLGYSLQHVMLLVLSEVALLAEFPVTNVSFKGSLSLMHPSVI